MKYDRTIEVCEFCDMTYHPMPVWSKYGKKIFVHHIKIIEKPTGVEVEKDDSCEKKALAAGYVRRWDLTPIR